MHLILNILNCFGPSIPGIEDRDLEGRALLDIIGILYSVVADNDIDIFVRAIVFAGNGIKRFAACHSVRLRGNGGVGRGRGGNFCGC